MHQIGEVVLCAMNAYNGCKRKFKKKTAWHKCCSRKCSNDLQAIEKAAEIAAATPPAAATP